MQPQATIDSVGTATAGSVKAGPFEGPLTFEENGLSEMMLTRAVTLKDAVVQLDTGAAPTQGHAFLICVDELTNTKATLYSGQLSPASAQRLVPKITFQAGRKLIVKAVQISGTAAEATQLILSWA